VPGFSIHHNLRAVQRGTYAFGDLISATAAERARSEMSLCPHYQFTPLLNLAGLARSVGVERVFYKDEASRFGLGSFKALGGAYAVALLLIGAVSAQLKREVSIAELARGSHSQYTRGTTVVCASDGKHGRAVAAGARVFGCNCVIYLHEGVSAGREAAIAALGALVVRTPGNYDESVRAATAAARLNGWQVVSDTSWSGYEAIPATVMQGYSVMVLEVLEQLSAAGERPPTHVFLQAGVGGLAAAVVAHLWEVLGPDAAPVFIVVEPERADCLYQSAVAGRPTPASGDLHTLMAGLACGEVSEIAWRILHAGAEFFMTIPDAAAVEGMRLLAQGAHGDPPIVAGESATAGLAALLALSRGQLREHGMQERAGLDGGSRVLLFGTEGATDPQLYRQLMANEAVSAEPQEVRTCESRSS
jgi:diaminopropionate ammonia-lyase